MFKEIFTRLIRHLPSRLVHRDPLPWRAADSEYGGPAILKCALPENGGDA